MKQRLTTVTEGWDMSLAMLTTQQRSGSGSSDSDPTITEPKGDGTSQPESSGKDSDEREDEAGDETEKPELPLDQVFEILKNRRRRETLKYLLENGGNASLSDLAEHIAAIENDTTVRAISSSQRKRVYVGLYQCHLPKMDDMDIVDFDQNRGTIELSQNVDQLETYLEDDDERAWYKAYLGLTLVGAGLFAAGQVGLAQYGLTPIVILLGMQLGVAAISAVHAGAFDYMTEDES
jgi:hypothetical protein